MSRLYDDWKRSMGHKLPKLFKKTTTDILSNKHQPICITIPLKGGPEPVELTEQFLKVIEREYAVRYLEQIGVEPSRKHIDKVLEEVPLDNCTIKAGWWQSQGWLADAISIYPKQKQQEAARSEPVSNPKTESQKEPLPVKETEPDEFSSDQIPIDLNIENIKQKFLYPFFSVKKIEKPKIKIEASRIEEDNPFTQNEQPELFDSKIFKFPFEDVTIGTPHIKEMMEPIETSIKEIQQALKLVIEHFPLLILKSVTEAKKKVLQQALEMLNTENMARLIGLAAHFCYWTVFGHLHSVGVTSEQREEMFITLIHLFTQIKTRLPKDKTDYIATLILVLRMLVDHIFQISYRQFFSVPTQAQMAYERIQNILTKLFDADCFFSRFSFLESHVEALEITQKARTKMSEKYFSTSSAIKSLFPRPEHPRTRAILAKQEAYQGRLDNLVKTGAQIDGTMSLLPGKLNYYEQSEPWKLGDYLDMKSRARLYMIAAKKHKEMPSTETVKVVIRVRPLDENERKRGNESIIEVDKANSQCYIMDPKLTVPKTFAYDSVYGQEASEQIIYDEIAFPLVENVIEGYNGTIFAYGQTGCGKTFTMLGIAESEELKGIIPNSFEHVFGYIADADEGKEFLVRCSYLEIYNETIRDLLEFNKNKKLELKEEKDKGIFVKDLQMQVVGTTKDIEKAMDFGNKHRVTGETKMNARSSRSHAIFTIYIETSEIVEDRQVIKAGKLNLVDLAGSERQKKTEAAGDRLKEAIKINFSLSALGNVINSLVENHKHIPYRDSKLTLLLQDSLGGNTKTVMIAVVSPADYNYEESLSTLRYASRAKFIKNKPRVNEDPKDALIREYSSEIQRLKDLLAQHETGQPIIIEKIVEKIVEVPINGPPPKPPKQLHLKPFLEPTLVERESKLEESHYSDDFEESFVFKGKIEEHSEELEKERNEKARLENMLEEIQHKLHSGGEALSQAEKARLKAQRAFRLKLKKQKQREKLLLEEKRKKEEEVLMIDANYESLEDEVDDLRRVKMKLRLKYKAAISEIEDLNHEHANNTEELLKTIREKEDELGFYKKAFEEFIPKSEIIKLYNKSKFDEMNREWKIPGFVVESGELEFPNLSRPELNELKERRMIHYNSEKPPATDVIPKKNREFREMRMDSHKKMQKNYKSFLMQTNHSTEEASFVKRKTPPVRNIQLEPLEYSPRYKY